jgi:putative SOS response-associated peptidase YedK
MCGRFTQHYTWREIHELYGLVGAARNIEPRYNIAPTTNIDTIISTAEGLQFAPMRWGLIPAWWKKTAKEAPATFNARAEGVAEEPIFRSAFKSRRCLIPASGYYEWKNTEGKKEPFYITAIDGTVLTIAGLHEVWKEPGGDALRSCTMIVTAADDFMAPIHDRMPVLLSAHQFPAWLSGDAGTEILKPALEGVLKAAAVSPMVNAVKNQGAELVAPLTPPVDGEAS